MTEPKDWLTKLEGQVAYFGEGSAWFNVKADELRHLVRIARAAQHFEFWRQLYGAAFTEENMDDYHDKFSEVEDNELLPALRDAGLLREEESGS